MNVPYGRLQDDQPFALGRPSEITREELKFAKFIKRVRTKFSKLFYDLLKKQLVMKNIIKPEEWVKNKDKIIFEFATDNQFDELKNLEIMNERINLLNQVDSYTGRYFSVDWIKRNILHQDDELIDSMAKEMEDAKNDEDGDEYGSFELQQQQMFGGGFEEPEPEFEPEPEDEIDQEVPDDEAPPEDDEEDEEGEEQ